MFRPMLAATALGVAVSTSALAQTPARPDDALVVTASNAAANHLLVYSTSGTLLTSIATGGQGGVSGNAGGIAADRDHLAVVNFGSGNVSVLSRERGREMQMERLVPSIASPVSVAFAHHHLYILSTTHVESHSIDDRGVDPTADGSALLLLHDGSAAQVGVISGQLVVSEKAGDIETVGLDVRGAVSGAATLVANLPNPANAPFGLATRGNEAYVSIAHSNEIGLVRNDAVLTLTGSGTQNAPCWLALDGPFLFSANSPSHSVSRYVVYGQHIFQDVAVAASFNGNPTDIAYRAGVAAVVDANGTVSHVSVFRVDEDGNLAITGLVTLNSTTTNGVVVLKDED